MEDWHEQCAGWQIVLDRMKLANAGWLTHIHAERLLDKYFAHRDRGHRALPEARLTGWCFRSRSKRRIGSFGRRPTLFGSMILRTESLPQ